MAFGSALLFWLVGLMQIAIILRKRTGHYEFPFFFISTSLLYLGVQLVLFMASEGEAYGIEIAIYVLIAILSNLAVHMGFNRALRQRPKGIGLTKVSPRALMPFVFLFTLTLIAAWSFWKLADMAGGVSYFLSTAGSSVVWEDAAVRYTFAVQSLYIIFPISLFFWKHLNNKAFLVLALVAVTIPLANAFIMNRRFAFFLLGVTYFLFLFFQYRLALPKISIAIIAPLSLAVVTIFPLLRSDIPLSEAFSSKGLSGAELIVGQQYGEVKNGVLALSAVIYANQYEFGVGFPMQVFKDFVPSEVIGRETKYAILGNDRLRDNVSRIFGFDIPNNEYVTGISTAFQQLYILSFFMWYFVGYLFGKQWARVVLHDDLKSKILYVTMVPIGMMALYYSPTAALSQFIKAWIIIQLTWVCVRLSLSGTSQRALRRSELSSNNCDPEQFLVSACGNSRRT